MGLVQNLKKKFNNWVENTLVELSYLYMLVKVKQTTKKRDNSFSIESLRNNLTMGHQSITIVTSSQDTSEKTTMELNTTEEIVANAREWSIDMIDSDIPMENAKAIFAEFEEWIEPSGKDLEIMSLEPFDDQS